MSVKQQADAVTLGKRFAKLVRERNLPVSGVWVRAASDPTELWIVADAPNSRDLKSVATGLVELQRQFADTEFDHRILNAAWIPDFEPQEHLPPDVKLIALPT